MYFDIDVICCSCTALHCLLKERKVSSCCRRHFVGQLNRPSTQFSECHKDTCRSLTTWICQYAISLSISNLSLLPSDYNTTWRPLIYYYRSSWIFTNVTMYYYYAIRDVIEESLVKCWCTFYWIPDHKATQSIELQGWGWVLNWTWNPEIWKNKISDISTTSPIVSTGEKSKIWYRFSTAVAYESSAFRNGETYLKCKAKETARMISSCPHKIWFSSASSRLWKKWQHKSVH